MKFKSLFLLVTSTITLACTAATVNKEKYFEKTENNKSGYTKDISKSDLGYWSIKDCKLLSDGVGEMVGITGYLLEESSQMRDSGNDEVSGVVSGAGSFEKAGSGLSCPSPAVKPVRLFSALKEPR